MRSREDSNVQFEVVPQTVHVRPGHTVIILSDLHYWEKYHGDAGQQAQLYRQLAKSDADKSVLQFLEHRARCRAETIILYIRRFLISYNTPVAQW